MSYENEENFKETAGHIIDGIWYPRVTKILDIKAKPALYRFYGEAASYDAAKTVAQKSAEEGTKIHEVIESLLMDENPEITPEVKPAVTAFLKFLKDNNLKIITSRENVERPIVNYKERYAGTADALVKIGNKFGILDIKTSAGIYREYDLQTSAYLGALKDEFESLETRWILRIDQARVCLKCGSILRTKGGRDKIYLKPGAKNCQHEWSEIKGIVELSERPNWEKDYEAFLAAKKLWEWENEPILKKIGYLKKDSSIFDFDF